MNFAEQSLVELSTSLKEISEAAGELAACLSQMQHAVDEQHKHYLWGKAVGNLVVIAKGCHNAGAYAKQAANSVGRLEDRVYDLEAEAGALAEGELSRDFI